MFDTLSVLGPGPLADRTGRRLARLFEKYAAPADVRGAMTDDLFGAAPVAANFADPGREYPLHAPAATWASLAAYHDAGSTDRAVGGRIKAACAVHRLDREWDRVTELAGGFRKVAAVVVERWALPAARKYPLDTPEAVKAAADYFTRHANRLAMGDRQTFAAETVKAANALGVTIAAGTLRRLEAESGLGQPGPDWNEEFAIRASLAKLAGDTVLAAAMAKSAADYAAAPDPVATAAALRQVDRRMRWAMPDPLDRLVGETPSTARAKLAGCIKAANGDWYSAEAVDRLPSTVARELFGLPGLVVSHQAKAELLRDPTKSAAAVQVLAALGVRPVDRAAPSRVDWAALAAIGA